VLENDPTDVPAETLRDIAVWGTVVDGIPRPASQQSN